MKVKLDSTSWTLSMLSFYCILWPRKMWDISAPIKVVVWIYLFTVIAYHNSKLKALCCTIPLIFRVLLNLFGDECSPQPKWWWDRISTVWLDDHQRNLDCQEVSVIEIIKAMVGLPWLTLCLQLQTSDFGRWCFTNLDMKLLLRIF